MVFFKTLVALWLIVSGFVTLILESGLNKKSNVIRFFALLHVAAASYITGTLL